MCMYHPICGRFKDGEFPTHIEMESKGNTIKSTEYHTDEKRPNIWIITIVNGSIKGK